MAGGIFVSYRRDDARQAAGRLADDLSEHFDHSSIFRDIEGIELGVDFAEALNRALEVCVVMLVVIGPRWLDIRDANGRRRLDDPRDWIRQEISTALKRGIRVVPVLIDGTPLPEEQTLPEDMQPLVRRQAFEIADSRWRGDLQRLVATLARVPGLSLVGARSTAQPPSRPPSNPPVTSVPAATGSSRKWLKSGIYAVIAISVVSYIADEFDTTGTDSQPSFPNPGAMSAAPPTPNAASLLNPAQAPLIGAAPPPVQAAAVPDLTGMWRTLDGEAYQITQQGRLISLSAFAAGVNVGGGQGQLDGQMLRLSMTMAINGVPLAAAHCNLQATPDFSRFAGPCQGPNGQFVAQMFR